MKQQRFEETHRPLWLDIESCLHTQPGDPADFPAKYRSLSHHLALAKARNYSPQLVSYLNGLAVRCHHQLYTVSRPGNNRIFQFIAWQFPDALRRNRRFVALSGAIFLLPLLALAMACFANEELVYSLMSHEEVRNFESMYGAEAEKLGRARGSDDDFLMFGYYIKNNIGVSFRTFAGGLLFGLGAVFFLLVNGFLIGGVSGHVAQLGYGEAFFSFVIGHGAFELTAIVFSGAAGLMLGHALIKPGSMSRIAALQASGKDAILVIYGSTLMLVCAAFLEAFWSSSTAVPTTVKFGIGALLWVIVAIYCIYAGRTRGSR